MLITTETPDRNGMGSSTLLTISSDSLSDEAWLDILYVYAQASRNKKNYTQAGLKEKPLYWIIRYNEMGDPVAAGRALSRPCWDNAVRLLDRYVLIEGNRGLLPKQYAYIDMLNELSKLTQEFDTRFVSMSKKNTLKKVAERQGWKYQGLQYVTKNPSPNGLQYIGYDGLPLRRTDGKDYTGVEG